MEGNEQLTVHKGPGEGSLTSAAILTQVKQYHKLRLMSVKPAILLFVISMAAGNVMWLLTIVSVAKSHNV